MKPTLLILALISAAAITGCSTAYRTGQTPDDVYYSAAKPQPEQKDQDRDEVREDKDQRLDEEYYDDRFLRMKVRNYRQWSNLDDWYYYDKYSSVYSYYYGSFNNPYNSWNYYYNPYCCCHSNNYYYSYYSHLRSPVAAPVIKRNFNLAGYTNTSYNNNGGSYKAPSIKTTRTYNTSNNRNNSDGGILRNIFNKDNSSGGRTYSPSNNSGSGGGSGNSGSGGSGGGTAPVTRPVRK